MKPFSLPGASSLILHLFRELRQVRLDLRDTNQSRPCRHAFLEKPWQIGRDGVWLPCPHDLRLQEASGSILGSTGGPKKSRGDLSVSLAPAFQGPESDSPTSAGWRSKIS